MSNVADRDFEYGLDDLNEDHCDCDEAKIIGCEKPGKNSQRNEVQRLRSDTGNDKGPAGGRGAMGDGKFTGH